MDSDSSSPKVRTVIAASSFFTEVGTMGKRIVTAFLILVDFFSMLGENTLQFLLLDFLQLPHFYGESVCELLGNRMYNQLRIQCCC